MRTTLLLGTAVAALAFPSVAFAQSTGSAEVEDVVVTGQRGPASVNGIQIPDTPKAKAVITQELIDRRAPGQSILDTINQVPGVSFQNNDAYGSSGGTLNIRGLLGLAPPQLYLPAEIEADVRDAGRDWRLRRMSLQHPDAALRAGMVVRLPRAMKQQPGLDSL